uniref:Secreted protein n=1 Tax=Utricularia reniformis TaxID=192314 RepID=A0A1Y0B2P3_9LAMI|nr:hypothetical protein AEK19_MT1470 [Utricularia reniformis]ART31661.1 hypothetical protein AEK19_MT1470 [Utricularia reniformis]
MSNPSLSTAILYSIVIKISAWHLSSAVNPSDHLRSNLSHTWYQTEQSDQWHMAKVHCTLSIYTPISWLTSLQHSCFVRTSLPE